MSGGYITNDSFIVDDTQESSPVQLGLDSACGAALAQTLEVPPSAPAAPQPDPDEEI